MKQPQPTYLFVYGTLRKGGASPVQAAIAEDIEWVGLSRIRGSLYDIGNYPGAVPTDKTNSFITGEVLRLKRPRKVLKILDRYEGYDQKTAKQCEYCRKKETVQLKDGTEVQAWIYWYNYPVNGKPAIPGRDYSKYLKKKTVRTIPVSSIDSR